MNTGKILQQRRKAMGLSRKEVACLSGISISHLKNIETGHVKPGLKTILRIASILELSLEEIMKNNNEENNE
jgi:transcriptional regulator with XRE-family HTH domain